MSTARCSRGPSCLVLGLLLLAAAAPACVSRNVESISREERAAITPPPEPKAASEQPASVAEVPGIDVALTLDPSVDGALPAGVVFLIVRVAGREGGPPLAVRQVDAQPPADVRITEAHSMIPGTPFVGDLDIIARLDQDGNAFSRQDGDLEGRAGPVQAGGSVQITLRPATEESDAQ